MFFSCHFLKTASLLEMPQEKHDRIPDVAFFVGTSNSQKCFGEAHGLGGLAACPWMATIKALSSWWFPNRFFDFNFGEMIQFDYKNHGISKQVVWRSQTPAIRIQSPL